MRAAFSVRRVARAGVVLGLWIGSPLLSTASPRFVGAKACLTCHADTYGKWDASRHSKMVRPASPEGVRGDFTKGKIRLRGETYVLEAKGGEYFITESQLSGKKTRHRILYTLGNRRIQHYLTALDDGRVVVLAPTWDVLRKEWFHNMEIVGREPEGAMAVQVWNKNCFGCHVSQEERNFDLASKSYDTDWVDFGTSCERCHGPGGDHVDLYTKQTATGASGSAIVVQTKLDNVKNTMVCGQCHSLRDTIAPGYTAGENYFDYFLPSLEYGLPRGEDPAWYVDGKTRRFSSNTLGIWQSRCFLEGKLACTNCHRDAHDPEIEKNVQLRFDNPALCTGCHQSIGADIRAHTHHAEASAGSSCVECHMPRSVVSIKAKMRDHSLSLPTPENTERFGIPNACNICHEDETPAWAAQTIDGWFPDARSRRQKLIARAETFSGAREGAPDAVERLVALAANESEPPLIRANAVGYLGRYGNDPRTIPAVLRALGSQEPILRAVAAPQLAHIDPARLGVVKPFLVRALGDDRRVVRMGAAFSLLSLGVQHLDGDDGARFEEAKKIYVARAATSPDHAPTQLDLGMFYLMDRDLAHAAEAFEASLRLDPESVGRRLLSGHRAPGRGSPRGREEPTQESG